MDNIFESDDEKGRQELRQCVKDEFLLFFSSNPICKHDGYLFSGITSSEQKDEKPFQRYIFDIKKRNTSYSNMIVEKDKYDYLFSKCKQHEKENLQPLYINVIDKKVVAWNLTDFPNLDWQYKWLPKTTSKDSGFEKKLVSYLPLNKSFEIK